MSDRTSQWTVLVLGVCAIAMFCEFAYALKHPQPTPPTTERQTIVRHALIAGHPVDIVLLERWSSSHGSESFCLGVSADGALNHLPIDLCDR